MKRLVILHSMVYSRIFKISIFRKKVQLPVVFVSKISGATILQLHSETIIENLVKTHTQCNAKLPDISFETGPSSEYYITYLQLQYVRKNIGRGHLYTTWPIF